MLEMRKTTLRQNGFSLIEIMIALSLLAVLGGSIMSAFTNITPVSTTQNNKAYNVTREAFESMNEAVRQSDWDTAANPLNNSLTNQPFFAGNGVSLDGTFYQVLYTVTPQNADGVSPPPAEDYKKVEGVVSW
jgi:prepilin-type N-terminal cleavage/methylation domain-containing protein